MKNTYHIMFTGAGRRVELIQAFRQAAQTLDINLKIFGADMSDSAPALMYCDAYRNVCGMRDSNYIPQLIEICINDSIDLIIPTIDTDLMVLSENRKLFEKMVRKFWSVRQIRLGFVEIKIILQTILSLVD